MSWISIASVAVIGAHGVGHALGVAPALGAAFAPETSFSSWLLGDGADRVVAGLLFALAGGAFIAAAVGLAIDAPWTRGVCVAAALASLAASAIFPHALPTASLVGSVAVNVALLVTLGLIAWQPSPN